VARPKHWRATATRLERSGYRIDAATSERRLIVLDASATLASFMRRGTLDARLFEDVIGCHSFTLLCGYASPNFTRFALRRTSSWLAAGSLACQP
jgi:hypothetical protein